jgi:hypothetical protein
MREAQNEVIEAMAEALFETFNRRASDLASFFADSNPMYAAGAALEIEGERIGLPRAPGEPIETYRARLFQIDEVVTPAALLEAVFAITSRFTASRPEYLERPDDEPWLFDDAGDVADVLGWYLFEASDSGVEPLEGGDQRDEARGSKPRHALIFDAYYRSIEPSGWTETTFEQNDRPIIFNGWGSPILVLPPFRPPGRAELVDLFVCDTPSISTAADLEAADLRLSDVASLADEVADPSYGGHVFDVASDEATVVSSIQAILASRVAYPVQPMILLDPEVTL